MKCDLCGMHYPPNGWTYYWLGIFSKNIIICSDCLDHFREVKEDDVGNIIGFEKAIDISGVSFKTYVMKNEPIKCWISKLDADKRNIKLYK